MMKKLIYTIFFAISLGIILMNCIGCSSTQNGKNKDFAKSNIHANAYPNTNFEKEFVAFFKLGKLPYDADTSLNIIDTMAAEIAIKHILEAAEKSGLHTFDDLWGNDEIKTITQKALEDRFINVEKNAFAVLNFGFVSRLPLSDKYYSLVFKYAPTYMEGSYMYTYLANYSKDGHLIDVLQIGGQAGYVDIISEWTGDISKKKEIKLINKTVKKGGLEDGSADFTEFAYLNYRIEEEGKIKLIDEKYTGFSGNFQSKSSKETLKIDEFIEDIRVLYKENPNAEQEQMLKVIQFDKKNNTIIAESPENKEKFTFTYHQTKKGFSCKKSDGSVQEFTRLKTF